MDVSNMGLIPSDDFSCYLTPFEVYCEIRNTRCVGFVVAACTSRLVGYDITLQLDHLVYFAVN